MTAAARPLPSAADLSRSVRDRLAIAAFLVAAAAFLFIDTRTMPIVLWDESRTIVNALEMRRTGLGLVTTYAWRPDLWNTKPPLLIWAMVASMRLFGATEWALRLPSALAALGTLLIVAQFVRRETGSVITGLGAAALLLLSPGFFAEHGARTADYDALLTFFTTAALVLLFPCVHRPHPGWRLAGGAALAMAAAVLTKSTAALVPIAAIGPYLLLVHRQRRLWGSAAYLLMGTWVAAALLLWEVAREAAGPGYLAATLRNDLAARFAHSVVGAPKPISFYCSQLRDGFFAATPLLVVAPAGLVFARGRSRLVLLHSLCASATVMLVFSAAGSKLSHYILPALPFMAIAVAVAVRAMLARRRHAVLQAIVAMTAVIVFARGVEAGVVARYRAYPATEFQGAGLYGELFASLRATGEHRVRIIDPGFTLEGRPHYAPVLRAYQLLWQERGLSAVQLSGPQTLAGTLLASCDPTVVAVLLANGRDRAGVAGCAAINADRARGADRRPRW